MTYTLVTHVLLGIYMIYYKHEIINVITEWKTSNE
jgi:hypothetical protein